MWLKHRNCFPGTKIILHDLLIDPQKILLLLLHNKLGLMKQFLKVILQDGPYFKYLSMHFPSSHKKKLKAGIFVGPQMKKWSIKILKKMINKIEKDAWNSFASVTQNVLSNNKDPNNWNIVETMLEFFKKMCCNMSVKLHFLHSHIN